MIGYAREAAIDDLYRQLVALETRRADALAVMADANLAGDDEAWDRAAELHDALSDELAGLRPRIEELEERDAAAYERQVRSDYYASIL